MELNYKEIKKILTEDNNILKVSINSNKKNITIYPVQNKNFLCFEDILQDFYNRDLKCFVIGDKYFKFKSGLHINTLIYDMKIVEV